MKILRMACLLLAAAFITSTASAKDFSPVQPVISTPQSTKNCLISVSGGSVLEISAADLERRMGMQAGTLNGITVTALPPAELGELLVDGVALEPYEYIDRATVDKLCFVPSESAMAAMVSFLPNGEKSITTNLNITVLATANSAPSVKDISLSTVKNIEISGYVDAVDEEEDTIHIQILTSPQKGEVRFNGKSFVYTPYYNTSGADSFTICAVDSVGNYSNEARVEIKIENSRGLFFYTDMQKNPSQYAAIKLHENGVMTGRKIGNQYYFYPSHMLGRGDFLVMLMTAAGIETSATVNTGLPNDSDIPSWLKPYVKKAAEEGIIPSKQAFMYNEVPIRAEAVLMTDRAANITDVKEFALTMPDAASIPDWARQSYMDLAAYRMLDLYDGNAYPTSPLTNSYAADLIWQLWKHYNAR